MVTYAVRNSAHIKCIAPLNYLQLSYLKTKLFHSHTASFKNLREFVGRREDMEKTKHILQRMLAI